MANTNSDLTEEDAADLQFPKDCLAATPLLSNPSMSDTPKSCANCFSDLDLPCIFCDTCNSDIYICLTCFASGAEFADHKSDHNYRIIRDTFIPFAAQCDWTAFEELTLIDAIMAYGLNWNLIAQQMPNRSTSEIIQHYDYFYLQGKGSPYLPQIKESEASVFPNLIVPFRFRIDDSDEPPRYCVNTVGYQSLAGYNPARSDFENEYDANAEDLLVHFRSVDKEDCCFDLLSSLQGGILQSYNRRLLERQRWKRVIKMHGLIMLRKTASWLHRYDLTITRPVYEKIVRFMQLYKQDEFELLMEGLHRAGELKIQISRLIQLRRKGITTLAEARTYLKVAHIHDENRKQLKEFRLHSQFNWKTNKEVVCSLQKLGKRRVGYAPIEIVGMPGYEKLTNSERDLCSNVRLVPISYLELKELLISENRKFGHIKLQTARRMLKIDVNKTRKLYDFLVKEGYICKSQM